MAGASVPGIRVESWMARCSDLAAASSKKPLIVPTLYKAVVFTFLVIVFHLVEYATKGLWQGNGLAGGLATFLDRGYHELLAGFLVIFVALIPFFSVRELGRVPGEDKIRALFFRKKVTE